CKNCQNWEISQANPEDSVAAKMPPDRIPALAKEYDCLSVAYTYTDPVAYYEYTLDACAKTREAGLRNILVTAGYMNDPTARELYKLADAANIDLKAFSDRFYREVCDATLAPVLNTLVVAKSMGVEVEVTNLLIPTLNDSDADIKALSRWVKENMGRETPLHFSRFSPRYRMKHIPPTPPETLIRARGIARAEGMYHVYIGNVLVPDAGKTFCHGCGALLVERVGYRILQNRLSNGACPDCRTKAYGVWK
ncbi:AmmeMemoRadiSam system radical SAM enzyme, partial [bacterium]|nr:AmmeMemoRadiSam system radical SAM enzyme [bacterium]